MPPPLLAPLNVAAAAAWTADTAAAAVDVLPDDANATPLLCGGIFTMRKGRGDIACRDIAGAAAARGAAVEEGAAAVLLL